MPEETSPDAPSNSESAPTPTPTSTPPSAPFEESAPDQPPAVERGTIEVLPFENESVEETMTLQTNHKKSWLPWKRPNRRDQQLRHLREGYIELLGLVRSISGHLERQKDEESQVSTLVESLPPALNSFEKLATSQKEVTAILGNLNSHMEKTSEKDEQLLENLSGFNSTLQDVSSSHEKSLGTLDKVSERIENSDEQMKMLFEQAHRSNEAAGSLMIRLEKRVFLSNMALVVLLSLLLLSAMIWLVKKPEAAPVTVVNNPAALPALPSGARYPSAAASQPSAAAQAENLAPEGPLEAAPASPAPPAPVNAPKTPIETRAEVPVVPTTSEPPALRPPFPEAKPQAAPPLDFEASEAAGDREPESESEEAPEENKLENKPVEEAESESTPDEEASNNEDEIEELDLFEYSYVNDWESHLSQGRQPPSNPAGKGTSGGGAR